MMVETVTGPIALERLGRTLMHEHLFISFAGAEFDPNRACSTARIHRGGGPPPRAAAQRARGAQLRRSLSHRARPRRSDDEGDLREIRNERRLHHRLLFRGMGLPVYWRARTVEEIAELYIREITHGIGETGVKAGAIKVATGAPG